MGWDNEGAVWLDSGKNSRRQEAACVTRALSDPSHPLPPPTLPHPHCGAAGTNPNHLALQSGLTQHRTEAQPQGGHLRLENQVPIGCWGT